MPKIRFWESDTGSSTAIMYREDTDQPHVLFHTNIGWVQVANLKTEAEAEEVANAYNLVEATQARAFYMAGYDENGEEV